MDWLCIAGVIFSQIVKITVKMQKISEQQKYWWASSLNGQKPTKPEDVTALKNTNKLLALNNDY